ncbi:MAG: transketolase [Actinobacteria bacterium]|nr:transketolase [Actinomycetota bacterium]MCL5772323.1 transketolase [Actinomycetota bacterium]
MNVKNLKEISNNIRAEVLKMTTNAKSGHPGGSLSMADILTVLYFDILNHDPKNPRLKQRDIFILSKGHCAPALYAALGLCGYFSKDEFRRLRKLGSVLQGHPDSTKTPGVEVSTGSLGNGLSVGCGIAASSKIDGNVRNIYVLLGDGECDEGQVWEAAMFASHYRLDNLIAIIDLNGYQVDGKTSDIMNIEPLNKKLEAFGWEVFEIDGHDIKSIASTFKIATGSKNGKSKAVIAKTIKGKGVSFMENENKYHGTPLKEDELSLALNELKER